MKIAINGFGRIGRQVFRHMVRRTDDWNKLDVVAINDLAEVSTLAHLLKYDSIHGRFDGSVSVESDQIVVNGKKIRIYAERDPENLPWAELGVDTVLESTGLFRKRAGAEKHIKAGAKRVVISAPAGDADIATVVLGVNDGVLKGDETVISNASCTTNNVAPMIKVLEDNWGVESAYITTIHAYTSDQRLHDAPHKDLRRARSAPNSIVPTTTGAAKAVARIFPHLEGQIGGAGIRVPVPNGSMTDVNCTLKTTPTVEEVNEAFRKACEGPLGKVMYYETDPIVSVDIIGNTYSCIFDSELTSVVGKIVKVVGWYDNEIGYSNRLIDLMADLA